MRQAGRWVWDFPKHVVSLVFSQKLVLFVYNELLFASVSYYFVIIMYDSYLLICYYLFMLLVVHV